MIARQFRFPTPLRLVAVAGVAVALGAALTAYAAATPAAKPASTRAVLGTGGWKVLTSATASQSGQQISTPGFSTAGWLSVAPDDAGAPGTEIEALLQNGGWPHACFSLHIRPGVRVP